MYIFYNYHTLYYTHAFTNICSLNLELYLVLNFGAQIIVDRSSSRFVFLKYLFKLKPTYEIISYLFL